ncbi:hypothetical protein FXO37_10966 [Capsicum annuum]|nr:hypothetical protein FXO37_10966 [Capsicum annuum]
MVYPLGPRALSTTHIFKQLNTSCSSNLACSCAFSSSNIVGQFLKFPAINLIASLWALAELWKNLVLLSPSFSYNILDLCLHAISSFLSNSSNSASVAAFATAASSVKALLSF